MLLGRGIPKYSVRAYIPAVSTTIPALRILAVRFSSIGDVLLTTPLLRALRARHPEAHLAMLTKPAYAPLLAANPRLDELLTLKPGEPLPALAARLRAGRYTHILDLHGSLRTRLLRGLVPGRWRGYPKHRTARAVLIRSKRDIYRDHRPVAERYFDAAEALDVQPDGKPAELFVAQETTRVADEWLAAHGLGSERALIALAPGAAHATKRWPAEYWCSLARQLTRSGVDGTPADIVVVGGSGDRATADAITEAAGSAEGRAASAAGEFDLAGSGALIQRADAAVSGDTGTMHIATAVGTPVTALFGPTVEAFGFYPYAARSVVLERQLDCRPCSPHGGPVCPLGHHRCLRDIGHAEVLLALRELIG
jgi:heptosyltransferase-2